jgi:thymidylate kinase
MSFNNQIITISGVHGSGKSTILELLKKIIKFNSGIERAKNPFQTTFHAMLFFVCSFSHRDAVAIEANKICDIILDRWSTIDIQSYIDAFLNIQYLTYSEKEAIQHALQVSPSKNITPNIAILLDATPEAILFRLKKFRKPSKHHIHERDLKALTAIREAFLENFSKLNNSETKIIRIFTNDKSPNEVLNEILTNPLMKKLSSNEIN